LGVDRKTVQDAEKIARITDEAKQAARDVGIDDNQSKLLAVAKEPPERQTAAVHRLARKNVADVADLTERRWKISGIVAPARQS